MRPPITIVMTTWAPEGDVGKLRIISARQAVDSWQEHLRYDGEIRLHIADDGSQHNGYPQSFRPFQHTRFGEPTFSRQARKGVGASLNAGFRQAFTTGTIALYAVDDWALTAELDLTPWVDIVRKDPSIGMIRLGPPHPDLTGRITHTPIGWYIRLDRHHYAFAHRPALYWPSFYKAYGQFAEGVNAFDCEREYAENFCIASGPDIAYALPYSWEHVGRVEVGGVVPA